MATQTDKFHEVRFPLGRAEHQIHPNVNIHFDQGNLVVEASLPGLELGDLYLHLSKTRLNLHGEYRGQERPEQPEIFGNGSHFGSFQRSLDLPAEVDPTRMTSQMRNGVLQIVVPVVRRKSAPSQELPPLDGM